MKPPVFEQPSPLVKPTGRPRPPRDRLVGVVFHSWATTSMLFDVLDLVADDQVAVGAALDQVAIRVSPQPLVLVELEGEERVALVDEPVEGQIEEGVVGVLVDVAPGGEKVRLPGTRGPGADIPVDRRVLLAAGVDVIGGSGPVVERLQAGFAASACQSIVTGNGSGLDAFAAAVGLAWLPSPPWKLLPGSGKLVGVSTTACAADDSAASASAVTSPLSHRRRRFPDSRFILEPFPRVSGPVPRGPSVLR